MVYIDTQAGLYNKNKDPLIPERNEMKENHILPQFINQYYLESCRKWGWINRNVLHWVWGHKDIFLSISMFCSYIFFAGGPWVLGTNCGLGHFSRPEILTSDKTNSERWEIASHWLILKIESFRNSYGNFFPYVFTLFKSNYLTVFSSTFSLRQWYKMTCL